MRRSALVFVVALVAGAVSPRLVCAQSNAAPSNAAQRVAVATRTLPRGTVLSESDFALRDTTLRFSTSQQDTTPVITGWVTRRTINAGEVLRSPAIEAPAVVNANAPVLIEWTDGNVKLTVNGVAARNGALGERIPVRSEMGKRFEATVVAPGRVRI